MLQRLIADKLKKSMVYIPVIALLGPRQVGKTTLAKMLMQNQPSIYLDLEASDDLLKLSDPSSFFNIHNDKLIILDEIQRLPDIFTTLRGIIDKNREKGKRSTKFLLLGSASMELLRQSSESLAGRISYFYMTGLNVLEISQTNSDINKLWLRGGFPDSYLSGKDSIAFDWLEDLILTYLERDIPQMGFRIPANRLRRLWTMLAHLQGEVINYSKIATNLEVDAKTVRYYLNILSDLLLIRRLEPWCENVKKRLIKAPRYYIRDSGIHHRLLGISSHDSLLSNPVLGKSWEGFVIENIHSILQRWSQTYFYRTRVGAEIDLIIKMPSSKVWCVEIKYGLAPKISKYFSRICDDVGANKKYVIYGGDEEFPIMNDVNVIFLTKFMQKLLLEFSTAKS
ncbi:ATP-binding protein [Rickettsiales endosymbiont of Trichoplax sp. H2]|uniref:ATP-binding protein n=1 Tax=Rickettsiales endosymbiont of Trichoplax sp. H2 TaxID=2021221 RepID=UPI0012B4137C|nr:ATP-binding protein [Rickettsiales endosymbiont of Trichoplax sp. H2]MSO14669.1 Uncharacterized protein [Rickettsiales endosymbiont of Trichoplax sp. H2]